MRVIQVARRFVRDEWGGTETVVLETSRRLLRAGLSTEIVCPNALAANNHEVICGVRVTRFSYLYPYFGLSSQVKRQLDKKAGNLFSFSLMRFLRRQPSLSLIHLHTGKRLGGIARHVARKRRIPYIVSLHGGCLDVPETEAEQWVAPTRRAVEWGKILGWWVGSRRVLDDAAAIICVGQGEYDAIRSKYPTQKVVHLPNGVDLERFRVGDGNCFREQHGIARDAKLILCVGRIDVQKNQLELVRSMPEWKRRDPTTRLVLIGPITSSDYERQVRAEIARLGLEDDVTIIPGVDAQSDDLPNAYHAADVLVLPSLHEPFGIVVVEAWAAGLPVVASRVGGLASLVTDRKTGRLFDPHHEGDCARTVIELLETPRDERLAMIRAGRKTARENYCWDRITERLLELYEEVIADASH